MHWIIQIVQPGDLWFDLCRCEDAHKVGAVLHALTSLGNVPAANLRVIGSALPLA